MLLLLSDLFTRDANIYLTQLFAAHCSQRDNRSKKYNSKLKARFWCRGGGEELSDVKFE